MKLQDVKEDKTLWEKMNVEGVGKLLLVEESYYDGIVELIEKLPETDKPGYTYEGFIDSIRRQLKEFARNEETDLFLLRNHLQIVLNDVKTEIKRQGLKETE